MWPREYAEFTIVGFGGYPLNAMGTQTTKIDFIAAQTTWSKIAFFSGNRPKEFGFHNSFMKEWLNTRYFKALPETWRRALSNPFIHSSQMNSDSGVGSLVTNQQSTI